MDFALTPEQERFGQEFRDHLARHLTPEIRAEGATTLRGIAEALIERGVLTRRGGTWGVSNVRSLIARVDGLQTCA